MIETSMIEINLSDRAFITRTLIDIQRRYGLAKEHLYKKTQMYFNQSVGSNYILEDQLRDMINECESIKKEYKDFQALLNSQEKRVV